MPIDRSNTPTHPPLHTQTGFDVITLGSGGGRRGPLARVGKAKAGQPAVGSYVVDLASFEKLALPSLSLVGLRGEGDGDAAGAGAGDGGSRKRPRKESAAESAAGGAASGEGSSDGGGGRPRVVVIDEVRGRGLGRWAWHTKSGPLTRSNNSNDAAGGEDGAL